MTVQNVSVYSYIELEVIATSKMASENILDRIKEDHLTCTICFQTFLKPKALPCLHTFCEGCLQDYVSGRNFDADGAFDCPICRARVQIPSEGIRGFPDNHLLKSLSHTVSPSIRRPPRPPPPERQNSDQSNDQSNLSTIPVAPSPIAIVPCSDGMLKRFGKYGPGLVDFHKPFGFAAAKDNRLIVTDHGGNRVMIFQGGELVKKFAIDCSVNDVTVLSNNTIMVCVNGSGSSIMRSYTMDGKLIEEFGHFYKLENASGIAVSSQNQVLVTGLENNCVYIFTDQRKFSSKFGRKGSGEDYFLSPMFIAINNKDHIVVSDYGNGCVKVFDRSGKFKHKVGHPGSNENSLIHPMGVCIDNDNNVIVADSGNFRVQAYTSKGKFISSPLIKTDEIGVNIRPVHVAITSQNHLAVLLIGPQFAEVRVYLWHPKKMSSASTGSSSCYVS